MKKLITACLSAFFLMTAYAAVAETDAALKVEVKPKTCLPGSIVKVTVKIDTKLGINTLQILADSTVFAVDSMISVDSTRRTHTFDTTVSASALDGDYTFGLIALADTVMVDTDIVNVTVKGKAALRFGFNAAKDRETAQLGTPTQITFDNQAGNRLTFDFKVDKELDGAITVSTPTETYNVAYIGKRLAIVNASGSEVILNDNLLTFTIVANPVNKYNGMKKIEISIKKALESNTNKKAKVSYIKGQTTKKITFDYNGSNVPAVLKMPVYAIDIGANDTMVQIPLTFVNAHIDVGITGYTFSTADCQIPAVSTSVDTQAITLSWADTTFVGNGITLDVELIYVNGTSTLSYNAQVRLGNAFSLDEAIPFLTTGAIGYYYKPYVYLKTGKVAKETKLTYKYDKKKGSVFAAKSPLLYNKRDLTRAGKITFYADLLNTDASDFYQQNSAVEVYVKNKGSKEEVFQGVLVFVPPTIAARTSTTAINGQNFGNKRAPKAYVRYLNPKNGKIAKAALKLEKGFTDTTLPYSTSRNAKAMAKFANASHELVVETKSGIAASLNYFATTP